MKLKRDEEHVDYFTNEEFEEFKELFLWNWNGTKNNKIILRTKNEKNYKNTNKNWLS